MGAMNTTSESEQLQKALTELATVMTRVICTRVDQAVTQIMAGKLPGEINCPSHPPTSTFEARPMMPDAKPTTIEEGFITKPEVAKRLRKTLRTVDNWMNRGLLPYYKIGRSVCFRWSEVEHHLAQTSRVSRR
jgi:excisionase family DNA binding protein